MSASVASFKTHLERLIRRFESDKDHYRSRNYSEAQARVDFITPFFKALGWDVENEGGLPPHAREVVVEAAEDTRGRPDYSFRVSGQTKFFVEAKAPCYELDTTPYIIQAKTYAWNTKQVFFVILTDFEEFRFYDASIRPDARRPDEGLLLKLKFTEYLENLEKLWEFSKESVLGGSLEALLPRDRRTRRLRIPVDAAFLDEMTTWRGEVARNIYKNNPDLTTKQLNEIVQRLLDRIVFVRIAEDRHVIERGQLRDAVEEWKARGGKFHIFEWLNDLFHRVNEDFNGEIFKPHLSEEIKIDSEVLTRIIERLYPPQSPYRFDVIGVELLGSVYERYLGNTIRITPRQVRVEAKPEVRKAHGVYYTPEYIVNWIVQNTVGKVIHGKSPKEIEKIRIIDPACGSGSFLIGAFQCLIDYHVRYFTEHPNEAKAQPLFPDLIVDANGGTRLSVVRKAAILKNNLFGIDIDPQAVEITMMSLYLKALEGERSQLPPRLHLLPELKFNVICGNSLVESDIYDQTTLFGDAERDRINAFDWDSRAGFGNIMSKGGFDCVIGNPPYAYRNATENSLRPYYSSHFHSAQGNYDTYKFFMERDLNVVRPAGLVGLIVSASFLVQPSFEKLREILLGSTIQRLAPLGPKAFADATVDTAVIVYQRAKPKANHTVLVQRPQQPTQLPVVACELIHQSRWALNPGKVLDYRLSERGARLASRLFERYPPIETSYELGVGINTGFIRKELTADRKVDSRYHPMIPGDGISRYGPVVSRGWIMYDREYVRKRGDRGRTLPDERLLRSNKILVVRTRNLSLPRRIIATIDHTGGYNLNRLSNIVERQGASLESLLGILNSSLFNWLYSTRFLDYEIKPVYLRQSPLADANNLALTRLVGTMLELSTKKSSSGLAPSEVERVEREMASTDAKIDDTVYDLYRITPDDRRMIEEMSGAAFGQG